MPGRGLEGDGVYSDPPLGEDGIKQGIEGVMGALPDARPRIESTTRAADVWPELGSPVKYGNN